MKSNITLLVESQLIREAKILAARQGTSVSAMLAKKLEEMIREEKAYEAAQKRSLRRLEKGWNLGWTPVRDRQDLHER